MKKTLVIISIGIVAVWGYRHWSGAKHSGPASASTSTAQRPAQPTKESQTFASLFSSGAQKARPGSAAPLASGSKAAEAAAAIRAKDLAVLQDADHAQSNDLLPALMRLSVQRDPQAKAKALGLVDSKDIKLKMAAIRALAYFDEPSVNQKLKGLLGDADLISRRSALQALSLVMPDNLDKSGREQILKDYVKSSGKSSNAATAEPERLMAMSALYRIVRRDDEKSEYFEKMLDIAKTSKREPIRRLAVQSLKGMAPQDKRVQELAVKVQ